MKIKLNQRQKHRKSVLKKLLAGKCTNREASIELDLCKDYIRTLKRKYKKYGDRILVHGNTGRKPATMLKQSEIARILEIKELTNASGKKIYDRITFAHFTRKLAENYGIKHDHNTIGKILKEHGYKSIQRHRSKRATAVHESRPRKERMGTLLQGDGTPFDWFGDGNLYCLQGFVDDATKIPTGLYVTKNECSFGYYEALRQTLTKYGKPKALYVDGLSVFFESREPTIDEQLAGTRPKTQFAEAMEELGVELIHAHTPEGKGRVERFWTTAQQILPVEIKERNITTVEELNAYLPEFIEYYSRHFSESAQGFDWRPLEDCEKNILAKILSVKVERTTDNGCVFSLKNYLFKAHGAPRQRIMVHLSVQDGIYGVTKKGKRVEIEIFDEDSSGNLMPQVWKDLIDEYFFKDAKAKYRAPYREAG